MPAVKVLPLNIKETDEIVLVPRHIPTVQILAPDPLRSSKLLLKTVFVVVALAYLKISTVDVLG